MAKEFKYNGLSFSFTFGETDIKADNFSLEITDNSTFAKTKGRPDGILKGDVEASGEITLSINEFKILSEQAKIAGAWQEIPTFDLRAYAQSGESEFKVDAFGCNFKLSSILDVDTSSVDKSQMKISYDVTGKDFVNIDGVPYIKPE